MLEVEQKSGKEGRERRVEATKRKNRRQQVWRIMNVNRNFLSPDGSKGKMGEVHVERGVVLRW